MALTELMAWRICRPTQDLMAGLALGRLGRRSNLSSSLSTLLSAAFPTEHQDPKILITHREGFVRCHTFIQIVSDPHMTLQDQYFISISQVWKWGSLSLTTSKGQSWISTPGLTSKPLLWLMTSLCLIRDLRLPGGVHAQTCSSCFDSWFPLALGLWGFGRQTAINFFGAVLGGGWEMEGVHRSPSINFYYQNSISFLRGTSGNDTFTQRTCNRINLKQRGILLITQTTWLPV